MHSTFKISIFRFLISSLVLCSVSLCDELAVGLGGQEPITVGIATSDSPKWDEKGYVLFCLCMGRFGNQASHFLGALAYAKKLDRTFVVPPFITYPYPLQKVVPFEEWFEVAPLKEYHRVITMEDFMAHLAPANWPPGNRTAYCVQPFPKDGKDCSMKEGNPFGMFWNHYNVDFDEHEFTRLSYDVDVSVVYSTWKERYPPTTHPVLAFKGAPASFPVRPGHRGLHKYMKWSSAIADVAEEYMEENIRGRPYVGIHLRIGSDWSNGCKHGIGNRHFMESGHCLEDFPVDIILTEEICYPSTRQMALETREICDIHNISVVYISSDNPPNIQEFESVLGHDIRIFWMNPERPQVDLYILERSAVFIGNCPSSFTAFVRRSRDLTGQKVYYWGLINKET